METGAIRRASSTVQSSGEGVVRAELLCANARTAS